MAAKHWDGTSLPDLLGKTIVVTGASSPHVTVDGNFRSSSVGW
jgi:hypothetical protein